MKIFLKTLTGSAAAVAMAVSATPVMADNGRDRGGIGAGEIIAGAVVLGGIAALAGAFDGKKDRHFDRRDVRGNFRGDYRGDFRGNNRGFINPRSAVNRCIRIAERRAGRTFGPANVTQIRDVDRTRFGYRVKGRIIVDNGFYGRGGRNNFDRGRFTCRIEGGRGADIRFRGLGNGR
jgi:hypothetical protein